MIAHERIGDPLLPPFSLPAMPEGAKHRRVSAGARATIRGAFRHAAIHHRRTAVIGRGTDRWRL